MAGGKNIMKQIYTKYSNNSIYNFFSITNEKIQLSIEYQNNIAAQNQLQMSLAARFCRFRDACLDLSLKKNHDAILEFSRYLWSFDIENAQQRGKQFDLASRMFFDITKTVGTNFALLDNVLSAKALCFSQNLNTNLVKYSPKKFWKKYFEVANSQSFKHGHELIVGTIHSAVTGYVNTMTGDLPIIHNTKAVVVYQNHKQTNYDFYSDKKSIRVENDVKTTTGENAANMEKGVFNIGNNSETYDIISTLARAALNSVQISKIVHVDPSKNNIVDKTEILSRIEATGNIEHAKDLVGFPIILNNDFTK